MAKLIPLSLGDAFRGYRIVGTTADYPAHYRMTLAQGQAWAQPMEAVLGAQVAQGTGIKPGDSFIGSHGLGAGGHDHGNDPYRVTGVLAPCGCVVDRLILTATESVWQVHEKTMAADEEDRKALQAEREVTIALITYKSPLAAASFPRWVNSATEMQAAAPAVEVSRLLRMVGVGIGGAARRGRRAAAHRRIECVHRFLDSGARTPRRSCDAAYAGSHAGQGRRLAAVRGLVARRAGFAAGPGGRAWLDGPGRLLAGGPALAAPERPHLGAGRGLDPGGGRGRGDGGRAHSGGERLSRRRGPVAECEVNE